MDGAAAVAGAPVRPYGWGRALLALLAGTFLAVALLVVPTILLGVVHLDVFASRSPAAPGRGWPWPVDGAWSILADLGPLLLAAAAVAWAVELLVGGAVGRRCARWPLALCAAVVGWVPLGNDHRPGVLGASTALAFVAMWWTTHATATLPRRSLPWSRTSRVALGAAAAAVLAALSLSYGALHPFTASASDDPGRVALSAGVTRGFPLFLRNDGPLAVRVLGVALAPAAAQPLALRVAGVEREGPSEAPTIGGLYVPVDGPRVSAGDQRTLWLTLAGPVTCARSRAVVPALDVRIEVAGVERTQRVRLAHALRVVCRSPRH